MIAYLILFASFCRVAFACIHWILVYFYCFVHTVKLKIYSQNTHKMRHFQHGNVKKNFWGGGTAPSPDLSPCGVASVEAPSPHQGNMVEPRLACFAEFYGDFSFESSFSVFVSITLLLQIHTNTDCLTEIDQLHYLSFVRLLLHLDDKQ